MTSPSRRVLFGLVAALLAPAAACTPTPSPGTSGTGGAGVAGTGGAPAGSGGRPGTGGAATGSGGAGTGGASATGGAATGGSAASTGGASGGTSSGGAAGGASGGGGATGSGGRGTAGAAGSSSGGNGGGRDAGADAPGTGGDDAGSAAPLAAAAVLDGFALLKPCFSTPGTCAGCTCDENAANILNSGMAPENQHITKQFGGEPGVTYSVKLRVVGIAERYWYTGGTLDAVSKVFYTGGLPTIHSTQAPNNNLSAGQGACKIHPPQTNANYPIPFTVPPEVAPADGCYNGFNIFAMTVSSPRQSYYLNQTTDYDNVDRQPHAVYKTDYTVTIPISGQAQLDFYVIDGDHHQVANSTMTVPNVKNTQIKQPYVGNFLEFEVVDATVAAAR